MSNLDITRDSIPRLITVLAIPSIISMVITQLYQLTDAYFISSLGTGPTAAVAINNSLEQSITMIGTFLCVGASSFISRSLGAEDRSTAIRTFSFSFYAALAFGIIIMILGLVFINPLVSLLGATEEIHAYCTDYAEYVLLAAPFMVMNFVTNKCLCAEGHSLFAMIGMAAGAILNVILDPIFIFTLDMGIAGASIATALSKVFSFMILLLPYALRIPILRISLRHAMPTKRIVSEIVRIGSPSLLRVIMLNTTAIIMNNIAGLFSTGVLAGIATSNRVMMLISTIFLGMGQGYQPVVGQNWGARKYKRILSSFRFVSLYGIIVSVLLGSIVFLNAENIMQIFSSTADRTVIDSGVLLIRSHCLVFPIEVWVIFVNMAYTATGKAAGATVLSLSRQGICYLPVLLTFPLIWGATGLILAQAAADVLSLCLAVPLAIRLIKELHSLMTSDSDAI